MTTAWGLPVCVASKAVLGRLLILVLIDAPLRVSSPQTTMSAGPSRASTSSSHPKFLPIFNAALESYKNKTKQDLVSHPLLPILQSCDSPEAIITVLRGQIPAFDQSQSGDDGLTKWVSPTVKVLYSFSATLGAGVGLVSTRKIFREVCAQHFLFRHSLQQTQYLRALVFSSLSVSFIISLCSLIDPLGPQAAKYTGASHDKLVDVFNRIEHFFRRLEIYTGVTPTTAMTDIIVEILVEVLTILAVATKEVKRGRFSESISRRFTVLY